MLKGFARWFICFGLSFLVECFGFTEQGRAFFYIECVLILLVGVRFTLFCLVNVVVDESFDWMESLIVVVIGNATLMWIILFVLWKATKLLGVNFFVAYQIMSFVLIPLFPNKKKTKPF